MVIVTDMRSLDFPFNTYTNNNKIYQIVLFDFLFSKNDKKTYVLTPAV